MMNRKLLILSGTILISSVVAYAQDKDFGMWYSISAEKELARRLELDTDLNLRTFEDASKIEEAFFDIGLTYKFTKFLSAGAGYRFTEHIEDDDTFHPRHNWFTDLKVKTKFGDFDISARLRYQQRYKTYIKDDNDKESKKVGRTRLKILYDIPSFSLNPYAGAELFIPVFLDTDRTIEKTRFTAGFEYNFSKKHTIEAEYMFQRDKLPKMLEMNIISLNYKVKF